MHPQGETVSFSQLEPSKENIKPLLRSTGKRIHSLARNLQKTPKALTEKQQRDRKQYENAIANDKSHDLNIWRKYIRWTKQNFPNPTNQKAQLLPLLERCGKYFQNDSKYINNKKYIQIWLEYANLSRNSMDIFKFMHNNKIGEKVAIFWRGWAIVATSQKQYDLVDCIFTAGINIRAQPIKDIKRDYNSFLERMRKMVINQEINANDYSIDNNNNNGNRKIFGQISNDTSSHRNNSKIAKGFQSKNKIKNNNNNNNIKPNAFGVFNDQKRYDPINYGINLPAVNSGWRDFGTEFNRRKENDGFPTQWNNQGFPKKNNNKNNNNNQSRTGIRTQTQIQTQTQNTFSIPCDDDLNQSKTDKIINNNNNNKLASYKWAAKGKWSKQGKYKCATFHDPACLIYNGEVSSLEEARYRFMKAKWNIECNDNNNNNNDSSDSESDDNMIMTMNVGKILKSKIPSTIKEEPSCIKASIRSDIRKINPKKRKSPTISNNNINNHILEPLKKKMKLSQQNININNNLNNFDVFSELTTGTINLTSTIHSHMETPMRRLDFATPATNAMQSQSRIIKNRQFTNNNNNNNNQNEITERVSMTAFFNHPIKITDKRQNDTPTAKLSKKIIKPFGHTPYHTQTFHTKAAMNDVLGMFGGGTNQSSRSLTTANNDNNNNNPSRTQNTFSIPCDDDLNQASTNTQNNNNNDNNFVLYEDTATIHAKIDIGSVQINDNIPHVEALSVNVNNDDIDIQIPLPTIVESENDDNEDNDQEMNSISGDNELNELKVSVLDPFDKNIIKQYNIKLLSHYLKLDSSDIIDKRNELAPVPIDDLLNGETDIELNEDEDILLNVTNYISSMSSFNHFIFVVNDLSREDDTETILLIDTPISFQNYHISEILKKSFAQTTNNKYLYSQYALTQSIYLYNNISYTLCRGTADFQTLHLIFEQIILQKLELNEKLILYYITEIIRLIYQLHSRNIIYINLDLNSFLIRDDEYDDDDNDDDDKWSHKMNVNCKWRHKGLILQNLNKCILLNDFVDINDNKSGCLINNNCNAFQELICNKKWFYEINYFDIFLIIIKLLTNNALNINNKIIRNNNIISEINLCRNQNGLSELQNKDIWDKLLRMLLMMNNTGDIYIFDDLSIDQRQNYLKQCYEYAAIQLSDLENLTPKLEVLLARLSSNMRQCL